MHPRSALLGPRSKKSIPEKIPYIFEKWHFLAVILKFFYILGNENPKKIPYNFSKESFRYSLENGTPLPPTTKKIFIFQEELPKPQKKKFFVNYFIYIIQTRKSSTKVAINPLSVNPRKWSNTLKQFVGWFIILIFQTTAWHIRKTVTSMWFQTKYTLHKIFILFTRSV